VRREKAEVIEKEGQIPACGGAGIKKRRRPLFAKSLRAGKVMMLVAPSLYGVVVLLHPVAGF
jgi:hypothetical protein